MRKMGFVNMHDKYYLFNRLSILVWFIHMINMHVFCPSRGETIKKLLCLLRVGY